MQIARSNAARTAHQRPGKTSVRIEVEYFMKKIQQVLGHVLQVFMQKTEKPDRHHNSKQSFDGLQHGDAAQAKVPCNQVVFGIHRPEANVYFILAALKTI